MSAGATVPDRGGVERPAVAVAASHVDISARPIAPATYPETWTPEIVEAVEAGRITYRRAERIVAARTSGGND